MSFPAIDPLFGLGAREKLCFWSILHVSGSTCTTILAFLQRAAVYLLLRSTKSSENLVSLLKFAACGQNHIICLFVSFAQLVCSCGRGVNRMQLQVGRLLCYSDSYAFCAFAAQTITTVRIPRCFIALTFLFGTCLLTQRSDNSRFCC